MKVWPLILAFALAASPALAQRAEREQKGPPGKQQGMSQAALDHILDYSRDVAKRNIGRVDKDLDPILQQLEHWLEQGAREAHA